MYALKLGSALVKFATRAAKIFLEARMRPAGRNLAMSGIVRVPTMCARDSGPYEVKNAHWQSEKRVPASACPGLGPYFFVYLNGSDKVLWLFEKNKNKRFDIIVYEGHNSWA